MAKKNNEDEPKHQHNYKIRNQIDTPQKNGGVKHEIQWNCTCGEWIAGEMWWDAPPPPSPPKKGKK